MIATTTIRDLASHSTYLQILEQLNIDPNWWCSDEYFHRAGWTERTLVAPNGAKAIGVFEKCSDLLVLPLVGLSPYRLLTYVPKIGIWADLPGFCPDFYEFPARLHRVSDSNPSILDLNYIYNPADFLEMKGSQWAVFRKNSRKFPRRYIQQNIRYIPEPEWTPACEDYLDQSSDLMDEWTGRLPEDELADAATLINYFCKGNNRMVLVDDSDRLLGMNIWDDNYKYINYRYCICRDTPFLSEYMRLLFYQDIAKRHPGKLVNDGGVLDRPGLQEFKNKMNPVKKLTIFTWKGNEQ